MFDYHESPNFLLLYVAYRQHGKYICLCYSAPALC